MKDVAIVKSEFMQGEKAVTKIQDFQHDEVLFEYCALPEVRTAPRRTATTGKFGTPTEYNTARRKGKQFARNAQNMEKKISLLLQKVNHIMSRFTVQLYALWLL